MLTRRLVLHSGKEAKSNLMMNAWVQCCAQTNVMVLRQAHNYTTATITGRLQVIGVSAMTKHDRAYAHRI